MIPINNWQDLQDAGLDLTETYVMQKDLLSTDPDYIGIGDDFTPLGHAAGASFSYFTGSFDANGHKIEGLIINKPGDSRVGLFAGVGNNASITLPDLDGGSVTASSDVGAYVGFAGQSSSITYTISGGVSSATVTSAAGKAGGCIGVARYNGVISDMGSSGNVTATSGSTVGGLIGTTQNNVMQVSRCFATGDVAGVSTVGGLIGLMGVGTFTDLFSAGNVTSSQNASANLTASGVASAPSSLGTGVIQNVYAVGQVNAPPLATVGGLIAALGSAFTVTSSYWDTQTTGQATSAGGTGKTTAEMYQQTTFAGWDFTPETGVWQIDEGNDYPELQWADTGIPVPDIKGLNRGAEAESVIVAGGFTVGPATAVASSEYSVGKVVSQNPAAGSSAAEGSLISYSYRAPLTPEQVVPDAADAAIASGVIIDTQVQGRSDAT